VARLLSVDRATVYRALNRGCVITDHVFGGDWTEIKLDCRKKYLPAYRQIFTSNSKARYFNTGYVDAFAATRFHPDLSFSSAYNDSSIIRSSK
jgi:hypothetical protein